MSYCTSRKTCKGCPIFKEDNYGNCIVFVKESKERETNRRNGKRILHTIRKNV